MKTIKEKHLETLAAYTRTLYQKPDLRHLFLELTLRCNAHCFHCGSSCTAFPAESELTLPEYRRILDEVKEDFDLSRIMLCVTGGEPLLRPDFFEIMAYAKSLGFRWGMTSNGTLITKEVAHRLAACGMTTVSISIDGLRDTHDHLRSMPGGYDRAMAGIQNLIDEKAFKAVQVTTVVNHKNIDELPALFDVMDGIDIDSWRVIHLEPIGRALEHPELMCTIEDTRRVFEFIRDKRREGYPVQYGCSHYLGLGYEAEVRDWYWLCNAGVHTASITANGEIRACLDIERRPELKQGDIRTDRFSEVWKNRFEAFRHDLSDENADCLSCSHRAFCRGGAHHSWDYENRRPMVCMKGILFE